MLKRMEKTQVMETKSPPKHVGKISREGCTVQTNQVARHTDSIQYRAVKGETPSAAYLKLR